jgi:hypothetical protein
MEEVKRTATPRGAGNISTSCAAKREAVPLNADSATAAAGRPLDPHGAPPLSLGEVTGVTGAWC